MKMGSLAAAAVTMACSALALADDAVVGSGKKVSKNHEVAASISRVVNETALDLAIDEGSAPKATVTLDDNLQELVLLTADGNTLRITTSRPTRFRGEGKIALTLTQFRALSTEGSGDADITTAAKARDVELETNGSGNVSFEGLAAGMRLRSHGSGKLNIRADADTLDAVAEGSGDLTYRGHAGKMAVALRGSGDAHLAGETADLDCRSAGSGDVDARELRATSAAVSLSGSGDATLTLAGGVLSATVAGSGGLEWWGTATNTKASAAGSGTIRYRGALR